MQKYELLSNLRSWASDFAPVGGQTVHLPVSYIIFAELLKKCSNLERIRQVRKVKDLVDMSSVFGAPALIGVSQFRQRFAK